MPGISLADTISQLSVNGEWGPEAVSSTTLDGVPYAPYSKGDKLGRMADWTQEGKDREGRGGRQYNRNYRGSLPLTPKVFSIRSRLIRPTSLWSGHFLTLRCPSRRR